MLWTDAFTLATFQTVAGFSKSLSQTLIVFALWFPAFFRSFLFICGVQREVFWNSDILWTAIGAVGSSGTWNRDAGIDHVYGIFYDLKFFFVHWLEILHVAHIVHQLCHVAHAT